MLKRATLIFGVSGLLIPIVLTFLQDALRYFQPEYIGFNERAVLLLWPTAIMTMGLHGQEWTLNTVLILSIIISINGLLYAVAGFVFGKIWLTKTNRPLPAMKVVWVGVGVLLCVLLLGGIGRPTNFELPEGYRGWVVIEYYNPNCPPLKTNGIHIVVEIPTSGHLCTSSPLRDLAWRFDQYEYVGRDGTRTRIPSFNNDARGIWAGHMTLFQTREEGYPQQSFFVGTAGEYEKNRQMPYVRRSPPPS